MLPPRIRRKEVYNIDAPFILSASAIIITKS